MRPRTVWAVYFSATHTTETVVKELAASLAAPLDAPVQSLSFTLPGQRESEMTFSADDLVVFGMPVYAGRLPNLMLPYLREKVRGNGAGAVPVVVYGNREYDDALVELRDLLESDGFHTAAAGAFIGEHSFSQVLAAHRPDSVDLARLREFARQTGEKVAGLAQWPETAVDLRQEEHQWEYYQPRDREGNPINILKVTPKTREDLCRQCGLCARLCPMGSIDPADCKSVRGVCIKCCACVKSCPAGAKYFDDPGYLLHKEILEQRFARRREPEWFL